jgi:hypothetical protein
MAELRKGRLVVVLGMHRSGTSLITRSLQLLGVGLGNDLHPAGFDNPKGFWEDRECLEINNRLLAHLGSAYDRLDNALAEIQPDPQIEELRLTAIQLISRKLTENNGIWGFKDPRTCRLLVFWREVFLALGCEVNFVFAVRNPASVAASLATRNNIPAEKAYFLWLQHVLPPLDFMKDKPRVVVDYDEFLDDPWAQLVRISDKLDLPLPDRQSASVVEFETDFLRRELRHARFSEADLATDKRASSIVGHTYDLLRRLATDQLSLNDPVVQATSREFIEGLNSVSPAFEYINVLEDERIILFQSVAERDGQITSLKQTVAERDGQITSLKQTVAERDGQITSLKQTVSDRDANLAVCERNISGLKIQVMESDKLISENEATLNVIYSSLSWRLTRPLRFFKRLVCQAK